jgi:hypothetical protein
MSVIQQLLSSVSGGRSWNPNDKAATIALSGSRNQIATQSTSDGGVRATSPIPDSGQWYWEVTINKRGYLGSAGIAQSNCELSPSFANAGTSRLFNWGDWYHTFNGGVYTHSSNVVPTSGTNWTAPSAPDSMVSGAVLMFAINMNVSANNGGLWIGADGTWFNSAGTANPATDTDPRWTGLRSSVWYPVFGGRGDSGGNVIAATANFGQSAFQYTPPSGFSALG